MKPSILRNLLIAFIGFGLLMGIIFPFYAALFVDYKEGMYGWFVIGCLVAGVTIGFKGKGVKEIGFVEQVSNDAEDIKIKAGDEVVAIDPRYFRPTEVDLLLGDPSKAKKILGWKPKYDVDALLREMVDSDLELMRKEQHIKQGGFRVMNYHE